MRKPADRIRAHSLSAPATVERLAATIDAVVLGRALPAERGAPQAPALITAVIHANPGENWHAISAGDASKRLGVDPLAGLKAESIQELLATYGRNELKRLEARSTAAILAEQLTSLPIALLSASAGLSIITGGIADAAFIGAVVLLNAGIATATERQAEHTILGLSRYTPRPVPTLRDGRQKLVPPAEIVPGDLIVLQRGTLIAADGRLIAADDLTVNESALTGEALPVHKHANVELPKETPLAERRNMVFRGTVVTGGSGVALVTAIGMATEIGCVQRLLGTVRAPETPIQRQLGEVGREPSSSIA